MHLAKTKILQFLARKDAEPVVQEMISFIHTIIEIDNLPLFAKGLDLLGDLSASARDFKNALHYYNKMVLNLRNIPD